MEFENIGEIARKERGLAHLLVFQPVSYFFRIDRTES